MLDAVLEPRLNEIHGVSIVALWCKMHACVFVSKTLDENTAYADRLVTGILRQKLFKQLTEAVQRHCCCCSVSKAMSTYYQTVYISQCFVKQQLKRLIFSFQLFYAISLGFYTIYLQKYKQRGKYLHFVTACTAVSVIKYQSVLNFTQKWYGKS